ICDCRLVALRHLISFPNTFYDNLFRAEIPD
ncbi:unnamed protein product, partial [Onchocerca ochengi]